MINCYENGQVNHINKTLIGLDVGLETNIHKAACLCNGQNTRSDFTYMILHTHLMYGKNHICNSKIHVMKNHIRLFDNSN